MALTSEGLKTHIKNSLGFGKVSIELTDDHLVQAIDNALLDYDSLIGSYALLPLSTSNNQTEYSLSSSPYDVIKDVFNVQYVSRVTNDVYGGIYEGAGLPLGNYLDAGVEWRRFQEQLQTAQYLYGSDVSWKYIPSTRKLYLKVPTNTTEVILETSVVSTLDDINYSFEGIFKKLSVAYAKEILGYIRRKYQGAKLPGGEVSLDGEALVTEAKEDQERLKEQFEKRQNDTIMQG